MRYSSCDYIFSNIGIYTPSFLLNIHCVFIHQNIQIGIEYFLEKELNFDFFCGGNKKSLAPFEYTRPVLNVWRTSTMDGSSCGNSSRLGLSPVPFSWTDPSSSFLDL